MTKSDLVDAVGSATRKALIEAVRPYEILIRCPEADIQAVRQAVDNAMPGVFLTHVLPLGYLAEFIDGIHAFV